MTFQLPVEDPLPVLRQDEVVEQARIGLHILGGNAGEPLAGLGNVEHPAVVEIGGMARLVEHAGGSVVRECAQARLARPQLFLRLPALGPVAEADADAAVIRKDVEFQVAPLASDRFRLEGQRLAGGEDLLVAPSQGGARGGGEDVPDHAVEHGLARNAEIGLRRAVDVGEAPFRIEGIERVADALQDHGELGADLGIDRMGKRLLQGAVEGPSWNAGDRGDQVAGKLLQIVRRGQSGAGHAHP